MKFVVRVKMFKQVEVAEICYVVEVFQNSLGVIAVIFIDRTIRNEPDVGLMHLNSWVGNKILGDPTLQNQAYSKF